jgi:hypothetical protein
MKVRKIDTPYVVALFLFGIAALLSIGCDRAADVGTSPTSVEGVSRELTPLYIAYDISQPSRGPRQDYGLSEHPTVRVIIVALKKGQNGKQDQVRIEDFTYPLTWEKIGDSTQANCDFQRYTTVSADMRCRAPGLHSGQAFTVINGVLITSPQPFTIPFQ